MKRILIVFSNNLFYMKNPGYLKQKNGIDNNHSQCPVKSYPRGYLVQYKPTT